MAHKSDSAAQREAEEAIRAALSESLGRPLAETDLTLGNGSKVRIDAVDDDETIFVEIFARQGRPRSGQLHKVSTDTLKLATLRRERPKARCILAFADDDAAAPFQGESWRSAAIRDWEIEIVVVQIDDEVRRGVREAQVRQVMVNSP